MTRAAWITMLLTWGVIVFFTARFFLMVLGKSGRRDRSDDC
jgi:hypothetical protein